MGKSVRQLLAEMTSDELTEWMAYYKLEPFGEMVADQRHGIATSVLANINRDPKQKRDPYKAKDFIYWDQSEDVDTDGEFHDDPEAQARAIKQAFGSLTGSVA